MRPVRRGDSPRSDDFEHYEDAKPELVSRLGMYCSYCERRVSTLLAVEHMEPKGGDYAKPELAGRWSNFLLACTNCNACKGSKPIDFSGLMFPDRDNTYVAFTYEMDGTVAPSAALSDANQQKARDTLRLLGLDKPLQVFLDANGQQVALDRVAQRLDVFARAQDSLSDYRDNTDNEAVKRLIVNLALSDGFFSIWMRVFADCPEMKCRFIAAFSGTAQSGCFDCDSGDVVEPAPNPDQLVHGGKV